MLSFVDEVINLREHKLKDEKSMARGQIEFHGETESGP
jgi:hypothetical protein